MVLAVARLNANEGNWAMLPIAIIVYSWLATATFDDFIHTRLNAGAGYVARHPGICCQESPLILEDVSLEECGPLASLLKMRTK